MEGRRHGRGGGGVGDAWGCEARARRQVPTSGGRRRGAGGEDWESSPCNTYAKWRDVLESSGDWQAAWDIYKCVLIHSFTLWHLHFTRL